MFNLLLNLIKINAETPDESAADPLLFFDPVFFSGSDRLFLFCQSEPCLLGLLSFLFSRNPQDAAFIWAIKNAGGILQQILFWNQCFFCSVLDKNSTVICEFFTGVFFKLAVQVFNSEFGFFFSADIEDDLTIIHHDQTVANSDGVFHVVSDHQRGQIVFGDNFFRQIQNFFGC